MLYDTLNKHLFKKIVIIIMIVQHNNLRPFFNCCTEEAPIRRKKKQNIIYSHYIISPQSNSSHQDSPLNHQNDTQEMELILTPICSSIALATHNPSCPNLSSNVDESEVQENFDILTPKEIKHNFLMTLSCIDDSALIDTIQSKPANIILNESVTQTRDLTPTNNFAIEISDYYKKKQMIPIFTNTDFQKIKWLFAHINKTADDQHDLEQSTFNFDIHNKFDCNELNYVYHNFHYNLFERHLYSIYKKYIDFLYENLDAPNIKFITKYQLHYLYKFLQNMRDQNDNNTPLLITQWLEQITMDEIREKNITLEYMPQYIKESILPIISPKNFQMKNIVSNQELLLRKIFNTDTESTELFNKEIIIKKLLEKNSAFIDILKDIFKELFLEKINDLQAQSCTKYIENTLHMPDNHNF